ncbi:YybS family protein [Lysinibacillus pakistanensis]|uniref:YybS family protein n=1 Tax=Lysinibacillus pakistanensis TaxID=759811 RepID=A0AAX3WXF5_9BACI|nr:YybS family protein [Lysinibacillus pakistanensis]MDM5231101.1 YybS family protein [Lysinibacillus pakistanensis]WHY46660.1 YybS family protein [Lysinibacillus pakistanensis]WHY51673.1 YybS family protein [Lysinibacillus pakistanensis]
MPNNQTKALVQGAAMVAVFTLMMIISAYIPLAFMLVFLFAPLPFAWYSAKYKRSTSILVAIVGCILTFITSGLAILPFAFIFAVLGIIMGSTIRQQKSKLYLFMSSGIAVLLSTAIVFLAYLRLAGINMVEIGVEMAKKNYEQTATMSQNITGQSTITPDQIEAVSKMMELTIPSTVTLGAFFVAFILISINLPVLKRLGLNVPKFSPFQHMRLPRSILWYYMIVLCINLFIRPDLGSTLDVIVINVSYILWVLLILQGISFIHYFISKKGMPVGVKWIATLLAIPLSSFMILLGIIDLGFDVRSLVKGKTQE